MPLFTWNMLITSLLILVAFPPLDRRRSRCCSSTGTSAGTSSIRRRAARSILYQHLFWFFGHPEVYIMVAAVVRDRDRHHPGVLAQADLRLRRVRAGVHGDRRAVDRRCGRTTCSRPASVDNPFFSIMSFLIAVPTGIKFFNWIGTMWRGKLIVRHADAVLHRVHGELPDRRDHRRDARVARRSTSACRTRTSSWRTCTTCWAAGRCSRSSPAFYYWFPKMTGFRLNERLGKIVFWLTFVGFNLTFWPLFVAGLRGMPRRIADYPRTPGSTRRRTCSSTLGVVRHDDRGAAVPGER